ncbi:MAG: SDR family oxidoreductase [Myxococcota bacterium]
MTKKIALVTGAGGGLGSEITRQLVTAGYAVCASDIDIEKTAHLEGPDIHTLAIDVTDMDSVESGVAGVHEVHGRIDLLINNAAMPQLGAIECVPIETLRLLFDINVIGYGRMLQAVLPIMRAQRSGHVVNVSSTIARTVLPGFGWYAATKRAVEGMSDALRMEVSMFGIDVTIIEPGLIATPFIAKQSGGLAGIVQLDDYAALHEPAAAFGMQGEGSTPAEIAAGVIDAVLASRPPTRCVIPQSMTKRFDAQRELDDRQVDEIMRGMLGLPARVGAAPNR